MRKLQLQIAYLLILLLVTTKAGATDEPGYRTNVIGVKMLAGAATAFYRIQDGSYSVEVPKARFAVGAEVAYNRYIAPKVAFTMGAGVLGKGYQHASSYVVGGKAGRYWGQSRYLFLEFPLGILLELPPIRFGIDLVTSIALRGKIEYASNDFSGSYAVNDWESYRRVNLNPRVSFGVALSMGALVVVPGVFWEMDVLNFVTRKPDMDESPTAEEIYRHMNVMGTISIELGHDTSHKSRFAHR